MREVEFLARIKAGPRDPAWVRTSYMHGACVVDDSCGLVVELREHGREMWLLMDVTFGATGGRASASL